MFRPEEMREQSEGKTQGAHEPAELQREALILVEHSWFEMH